MTTRPARDPHGRLQWRPASGDVVRMRRAHACGSHRMVVTHVGLDLRLSCAGCGGHLMLTRQRARSVVADVLSQGTPLPPDPAGVED